MVVNHPVKLSLISTLLASIWKIVRWKNPVFARWKTDLKRSFTPKKAYAYKAQSWLVFQTARVILAALSLARQLRSIQLRGAISLCVHSPAKGVLPHFNFNVRQKSTGNFCACTLALYHIFHYKSIKMQTFVCTSAAIILDSKTRRC